MIWPELYLLLPGTAREALNFYHDVFGGDVDMHSYADFRRIDGPADAIAHGSLSGPVSLMVADAAPDEDSVAMSGAMLSILGEEPDLLRGWFLALSDGGEVLDELERHPWGDWDGQVRDRFGVTWVIGFKG